MTPLTSQTHPAAPTGPTALTTSASLAERADRVTAALQEAEVDVLLVSDPVDLRYLTGYTGTNGLAVLAAGRRVFVTDFRYVEQVAEEVDPSFERIRANQDLLGDLAELMPPGSDVRLGFDDVHTSVRTHARLAELLGERVSLVGVGGLIERLRRVKDASEVERIAAAQTIADAALEELLAGGVVGRTEHELALRLETSMRERGASGPSFPSIIAAGAHGALPHAQPRDVAVPRDTLLVIDWGALVDGYCSDCTRTVATGEGLDGEAREVYTLVLGAQQTGVAAVAAGEVGREIDGTVRSVIEAAGFGERFGHNLGHGVGLDIHEAPSLGRRSDDVLQAGDVVTVEPGVYLPGRFGIRIEDLIHVGPGGPTTNRVLTGVSKELRVVD